VRISVEENLARSAKRVELKEGLRARSEMESEEICEVKAVKRGRMISRICNVY
jgi:hypothetical protein